MSAKKPRAAKAKPPTRVEVRNLAQEARERAEKSGMVEGFLTDVVKLAKAAMSSDTPGWAKAAAVGALAYVVLPIDLIPDFLPGGFLDDAAVVASALTMLFRKGVLTR